MAFEIYYSDSESRHYGIKLGRSNLTRDDLNAFARALQASDFDLVRIKVPIGEFELVKSLEGLGIPMYSAGAIINYSIHLDKLSPQSYTIDGLEFEQYDGSQEAAVRDIVRKSLSEDPIGFYKTPYLDRLISKKDELDFLEEHIARDFCHSATNLLFLLKMPDHYMGFVTMVLQGASVNSTMAAVYPEYRNKGGLKNIKILRGNFAIDQQIPYTINGCRLDNIGAQQVYEGFGMRKTGVDLVYHLLPFRSLPALDIQLPEADSVLDTVLSVPSCHLSRSYHCELPSGAVASSYPAAAAPEVILDDAASRVIRNREPGRISLYFLNKDSAG